MKAAWTTAVIPSHLGAFESRVALGAAEIRAERGGYTLVASSPAGLSSCEAKAPLACELAASAGFATMADKSPQSLNKRWQKLVSSAVPKGGDLGQYAATIVAAHYDGSNMELVGSGLATLLVVTRDMRLQEVQLGEPGSLLDGSQWSRRVVMPEAKRVLLVTAAQDMRPQTFACAFPGRQHIRDGHGRCQDHAGAGTIRGCPWFAVADGHGSRVHPMSHVGSRLAIEALKIELAKALKGATAMGDQGRLDLARTVAAAAYTKWRRLVSEHHRTTASAEGRRGVRHAEYGATLVFGLQVGGGTVFARLGDGDALLLASGDTDAQRVFGQTAAKVAGSSVTRGLGGSFGSDGVVGAMEFKSYTGQPVLAEAFTDGITDRYSGEGHRLPVQWGQNVYGEAQREGWGSAVGVVGLHAADCSAKVGDDSSIAGVHFPTASHLDVQGWVRKGKAIGNWDRWCDELTESLYTAVSDQHGFLEASIAAWAMAE